MKQYAQIIIWLSGLLIGCDGFFFENEATNELVVYDAFYEEIDRHYSFFSSLTSDFDSAYLVNRESILNNPRTSTLQEALQQLIDLLGDGHTDVFGVRVISYLGWFNQVPRNIITDNTVYFRDFNQIDGNLFFGKTDTNIGYIRIASFSNLEDFDRFDEAMAYLEGVDGMIIDVRSNGGGSTRNSEIVMARFNDQERFFMSTRRRIGGRDEFSDWIELETPEPEGFHYDGQVVVLTNRISFSATEYFVAGMRTMPHVTLLGDTTGGGSGFPLAKELPNGWLLRTSNSQARLPSGDDYQFIGIPPDIPLWIPEADSTNGVDTILEKALDLLSQ